MKKAKDMLLDDALKSAISCEIRAVKYKRAIIVLSALNLALVGAIIGLIIARF